MNFIARILAFFRPVSGAELPEFPEELATESRGLLRLNVSSLLSGRQRVAVFCHYGSEEDANGLTVAFHPAPSEPADPVRWQRIFDRRFREYETRWKAILIAQADAIAPRVAGWLTSDTSLDALFDSLRLKRLLISTDESVTLRFATAPLLKFHDLGVTFDPRDAVIDVEIEG